MGQFCSTNKKPSKGKDNALVDPSTSVLDISQCDLTSTIASSMDDPQSGVGEKKSQIMVTEEVSQASKHSKEALEAERALREKQRLEAIVSEAKQSMLAVHRRNGYYYEIEAAFMAAGNLVHSNPTIKQLTCQFNPAPPMAQQTEDMDECIIEILSKEMPWDQQSKEHRITSQTDDIDMQQRELSTTIATHSIEWSWLAGSVSGENISMYLDDIAKKHLSSMQPPSKEQFASGLDPIVENLP
jgi:hypothetical protein